MAAPQTGGYLSDDHHAAFKDYAASLNVTVSSLASLLVLREMNQRRLASLMARFDAPTPTGKRPRITAHHRDPEQKAAFVSLCDEIGVAPGRAASALFRAELEERWLRSCIGD